MTLVKQAEQFFTALNAQDLDTAVAMISPSAEVHTPIGSFTGGEAYREWISLQFRAIPDFTHEIRGITVESGDTVAFELHAFGTHTGPMALPDGEVPGTGRKIDMVGADFWRFEKGVIVEYNLYFDRFDFLTQLGALPSP